MNIGEVLPSPANLRTPLQRTTYFAIGLSLAVVKYLGDTALVWAGTHRIWKPIDYVATVHSLLLTQFPNPPSWLTLALLLWTIPFVCIGVTLTVRRALDAGWSPWVSFIFFVPFAGYALIALLCLWPSSRKYELTRLGRELPARKYFPHAVAGIITGLAFGLLMIAITIAFKGNYGLALFLGAPFGIGLSMGYVFCRGYAARDNELTLLTFITLAGIAGFLLLVAFEGAACLFMAFPLGFGLALLGAYLGRDIASRGRAIAPPAITAMLLIPLFAFVEPAHLTGRILHEVRSEVVIDASPEQVWPRVIAFAPMAEPKELMFRMGIAYPQFAHIDGTGVGAVRYCVFSTGPFVEPITAWEPGKRLAFDVSHSPDPMHELSWYNDVDPPHLHGYLRSRRGEFRLIALPGGRTRLEGSTW